MKIRTGFVTNSSSTSYGIAIVESILVSIMAGGGAAMICAVEELANGGEGVPSGGGSDPREKTMDPGDLELVQEIEHYQQEWEDLQRTLDPDDPSYEEARQEYADYIDHLENRLEWREYDRYTEEVERFEQEARRQAEQQWIQERQRDLEQVLEQQSFIEATRQGYGSEGFDVREHNRQLENLAQRERELRNILRENDADIDYTPRERDPIGPSDELLEIRREREEELQRLREAAEAERQALEERRQAIREATRQAQIEFEEAERSGNRWHWATRFAELVKFGADVGVDVLATLTGPAGKKVKMAYTGLKEVGTGIGESIAEGGNVVDNVGRGLVRGGSNIIKDKLGDKDRYGRYAQGAYTVASETVGGMYGAYRDGESMVDGAMTGALQGGISAAGSGLTDYYLPGYNPGVDLSDSPLSQVPGNLVREAASQGLKRTGASQTTNFIAGKDVVFEGFNHGYIK